MLQRHEIWVLRKLRERAARRAPPLQWSSGEAIMFLGAPLTLDLVPGEAQPAAAAGRLVAGAALPGLPERVAAWLKEEALVRFRARVDHFQPLLAVDTPRVRLSNARTRWGSCHAAGRISLNWRLIQMPLRLIDYVVVHELAHLREMNHSHRFWTIVGAALPDYLARRRELLAESGSYLRI
jgi:predicted metal-dependent hydrolase